MASKLAYLARRICRNSLEALARVLEYQLVHGHGGDAVLVGLGLDAGHVAGGAAQEVQIPEPSLTFFFF